MVQGYWIRILGIGLIRHVHNKNIYYYNKVALTSNILLLYHRGCSQRKEFAPSFKSSPYFGFQDFSCVCIKIIPNLATLLHMMIFCHFLH